MQIIHGEFTIQDMGASYAITLNGTTYAVTKAPKVMLGYDLLRWVETVLRTAEQAPTKS